MVTCPHCSVENADGAAFCVSCGKALPLASAGPKVVSGDQFATTAVGRGLQGDQLKKQLRTASNTLFLVGVLMVVGGVVVYAMLQNAPAGARKLAPTLLVVNLVLAAIFFALGGWARVSPLPAAIVGLALFLTLQLVNAVLDPTTIAQGIIVKVIVIVVLIKSVSAGMKYKQLLAQSQAA